MARYFYRCLDCLSVSAVDLDIPLGDGGAVCTCGGPLECMGEVKGDRLIREEDRCPCDDRCTCARGPKCDCKCGGKNHGSNMLVTVVIDQGLAILPPFDPRNVERGKVWKTQLFDMQSWGKHYWASGWIPDRQVWERKREYFSLLMKSQRARTWSARDKAMAAAVVMRTEEEV